MARCVAGWRPHPTHGASDWHTPSRSRRDGHSGGGTVRLETPRTVNGQRPGSRVPLSPCPHERLANDPRSGPTGLCVHQLHAPGRLCAASLLVHCAEAVTCAVFEPW